jgi:hypothetical protein
MADKVLEHGWTGLSPIAIARLFMGQSRNMMNIHRLLLFTVMVFSWFSSISWIPTSLHVLFLATLGQWCWTTNLDLLYRCGIDPLFLLRHRKGYSVAGNYGISSFMSSAVILGLVLYSSSGTEWANVGGFLPGFIVVYIVMFLFWAMPSPWRLYLPERMTAIETFTNSFTSQITLAEVVLCDLLTSYSRIIMMTILEGVWMVSSIQVDHRYSIIQSHISNLRCGPPSKQHFWKRKEI